MEGNELGPGGKTMVRKLFPGDVARTAELKATWIIALACTNVPLLGATMMVSELMILQALDATAEDKGLPIKTTHE
jgi:hypothetical protein